MRTSYALLVTALTAQQAVATWNFYDNFQSPQYNDNECSSKQQNGYDWSDLQAGTSNFQYDDFDFSGGWSCSNAFGKRNLLSKRTFGSKVIQNSCSKTKPASFSCDKRKSGFSITDIDVSVEFDVELELHYKMGDGSTCRQISSCSASGSTITNTQCGGATSVEVYIGSHYQGEQSECQIGLHRVGFDCSPPTGYSTPTPPTIPSSSAPVKSQPVSTSQLSSSLYKASTPAASTSATSSPKVETSSSVQKYSISSPTPQASSSCVGGYGQGCTSSIQTPSSGIARSSAGPYTNSSALGYSSPPTYKTSDVAPPSYGASSATPPSGSSTPIAPPPSYQSSSVIPSCGAGYGASCGSSSAAPSESAGTYVPATGSSSPVSSSPVSSSPASPSPASSSPASSSPASSTPSYTPLSPPDVLPKCINTWLQIQTQCKDNSDANCYCVNPDFTKSVIDCVSAWCGTDDETRSALQYLIGICAQYVPQNPKIIGDCPSYIPLNPTTPAATQSASMTNPAYVPNQPYTTVTYGSSSLTVPQVHFSTQPQAAPGAQPTQPVGLIAGTAPPQTPAMTTAVPYPVASTLGTQTTVANTGPSTSTKPAAYSAPAQFTGAATVGFVPKGALFGAALAFLAF